jgi:hypothetical protein
MRLRRAFAIFLPSAILATALCGLVYIVVQQDLRTGANDPQQQLAEDAAVHLDGGAAPSSVVGPTTIDVARSLAPFIVVYDPTGTVLANDGVLDGNPPMLPGGVLESATATGRDAVTWQPREGVRVATVTIPWNGGTVTSGRSLRLVEEREAAVELIVAAAWVATLIALVLASMVAAWLWPRVTEPRP